MHHQTVGGSQSRTRRAEHVKVGRLLRVESMQCRRCTKAYRNGSATGTVQSAQSQFVGRLAPTVDTLPNPFEIAGFQLRLEAAPSEVTQNLAARRYPSLFLKQSVQLAHDADRRCSTIVMKGTRAYLWMSDDLWTAVSCDGSRKCQRKSAVGVQTRSLAGS